MKKYKMRYIDAIGNIYVKEVEAESKGKALNILYEFLMENGMEYNIESIVESEGEDD